MLHNIITPNYIARYKVVLHNRKGRSYSSRLKYAQSAGRQLTVNSSQYLKLSPPYPIEFFREGTRCLFVADFL